jgi:VIT1/CCC1 family predicted Fe2+/Mn2+ transporter
MNNATFTTKQYEYGAILPISSSSVIKEPSTRMEHLGMNRVYWRDAILGVNDGLISTFLLVAGVAGGSMTSTDILLTAIAGALAGSVSMAAGEWIATKSQNEVLQGEIGLEKIHIRDNKAEEIEEVTQHLKVIGIPESETELRRLLIEYYENDPSALLKLMVALEFGVVEEEKRSPIRAALFSGILFFAGSLPSLLPFIPKKQTSTIGLLCAAIATSVSLLLVGGIKTWATRGNAIEAAVENLAVAGLGGVIAYVVGFVASSLV